MKKLYCEACGNYLMAGDGECHDCPCGWKQPQEHNMSVDWHNNAQRAKQIVWVVKIYEHDCVTDKTRLLSETGAPTEEIAHSWAKVTIDFWSGESARIPEANATFFVPDVYLVPQKVYTYSILEQHNQ